MFLRLAHVCEQTVHPIVRFGDDVYCRCFAYGRRDPDWEQPPPQTRLEKFLARLFLDPQLTTIRVFVGSASPTWILVTVHLAMLLDTATLPTCIITRLALDLKYAPQSVGVYWYAWDRWAVCVRVSHLFRFSCDLRQMANECNDLGALLSADGLVLPFDVALYAGWVDGELASLANDNLTFSVMYKQFLEYIHNVSCLRYATVNAL